MTTEAKIEANRRNAARSTGPRTEAGKATAAMNAVKHGLTADTVLLADEDEDSLNEFRAGLMQRLNPVGELEELLAERIVASAWRLRRVAKIEVALLETSRNDVWPPGSPEVLYGHGRNLGYAFLSDAEGPQCLGKLSRYESGLERSMYRALHELQRLQAARAGQAVPPPVTVDVTVDGGFVSQKPVEPRPVAELPDL
jgi:hypothetical protein